MAKEEKKVSIEENLNTLENLISKLEAGNLTLEESLQEYAKGVQLIRETTEALGEANKTLEVLRGVKEE